MVQQSNLSKIQKYYGSIISLVIYLITGFLLGNRLSLVLDRIDIIPVIVIFYCVFIISVILNLIIHEGGHLVFGLVSGYRFQSFRVGSLMIIKVNNRLVIKKFKLAGTGGQCILSLGENRKYFLYNIGGVMMNMLVCIPLFILANSNLLSAISGFIVYTFSLIGISIALTNGIPLNIGGIDNDGMNILTMYRSKSCREAFFQSLIIQEQMAKGISISAIDDALFIYDDSQLRYALVSYLPMTLSQKRLVEGKIEEWKKLDERLNQNDVNLISVNYNLLKNDENYVAYLEGRPIQVSKKLKQFNQSMKNYPGVIRSNYIQALSEGKNPSQYKKELIDLKKNYPYPGDIDDELQLIERVEKKISIER